MRMSETTKNSGEKLSVTPTKTLTLKRTGVEQGVVRQSFSHGRSKAVVVEKVKRRLGPGEGAPREAASAAPATSAVAAPKATIALAPTAPRGPTVATPLLPPKTGVVLPTLTEE